MHLYFCVLSEPTLKMDQDIKVSLEKKSKQETSHHKTAASRIA